MTDRRLDELVGNSGRLKEASHDAVVRMLRLFNLCDVGPTITQADLSNGAPRAAVARSSAPASPAAATPDDAAPMQVRREQHVQLALAKYRNIAELFHLLHLHAQDHMP